MAYFKNMYEEYYGACPDDDDYECLEIDDAVTEHEFDLFATAELSTLLEELEDSTDSVDRDRREAIVNVLRRRGWYNRIEDIFSNIHNFKDYWIAKDELKRYYTLEEIDRYKTELWNNLASNGAVLGQYLTEPAIVEDGELIPKIQQRLIRLSKQHDVVCDAWREKYNEEQEEAI